MFVFREIPITVSRKLIRSLRLRIKEDGTVYLSVPLFVSRAEIERFLAAKYDWMVAVRKWEKADKKALRNQLLQILTPMVEEWVERLGEAPVSFTIRDMRTVWGSCTPKKRTMRFNLRLVEKELPLIEYVVVHELTHLQVPNHGPNFHRLMAERMPDYNLRRKALNKKTSH